MLIAVFKPGSNVSETRVATPEEEAMEIDLRRKIKGRFRVNHDYRVSMADVGATSDEHFYYHRDTGQGFGWMPSSSHRPPHLNEFLDVVDLSCINRL